AVGTAMPETLIPIVAVTTHGEHFHEVGIGAIAGAPFMLTTLTMCVCGTAIWIFSKQGKRPAELNINKTVLGRDLSFFIAAYAMGLLATLLSGNLLLRQIIAVLLVATYGLYLKITFAHEGEVGEEPELLHFERLKMGTGLLVVILQVIVGLAGILWGAHQFVDRIHSLATFIDIPSVILAMIVAPIATELPEKFNSVIWVKSRKDTLALGNITGALVFQSCFPVAFGVAFTKWQLGIGTILSGTVALLSAICFLFLIKQDKLKFQHMMIAGMAYAATIGYLLYTHLTD
ncbi:MAG: hypothetical protein K2X27_28335, partial [Candidatus Obscuribacterales bacterium]|nr:hypothetical protein [Candidatus Obscuribacterales bacterium]